MKTIKVAFANFAPDDTQMHIGYDAGLRASSLYRALEKNYHLDLSGEPDYVFAAPYPFAALPDVNAVRVLFSYENYKPDFNIYDYAITIFPDFHFRDRHLFLDSNCYYGPEAAHLHNLALKKHLKNEGILAKKTGFCSYMVSNAGRMQSQRDNIFDLLSAYRPVDSGGRYRNNVGGPVADKLAFDSTHKFSIAFENVQGYTTEKLQDAFAAKTVPIYWGNPDIGKSFNIKAFVNCHDFNSLEEAVARVREIDTDDALYLSMLNEPAFLQPKTADEYLNDLENFLIHIIETPKEQAIQRVNIGQNRYYEAIQRYGTERLQREEALFNKRAAAEERCAYRKEHPGAWLRSGLYALSAKIGLHRLLQQLRGK